MLPFKLLRGVFEADELLELHGLMEEKELRLRKPLVAPTREIKEEESQEDAREVDDDEDEDDDRPIVFT